MLQNVGPLLCAFPLLPPILLFCAEPRIKPVKFLQMSTGKLQVMGVTYCSSKLSVSFHLSSWHLEYELKDMFLAKSRTRHPPLRLLVPYTAGDHMAQWLWPPEKQPGIPLREIKSLCLVFPVCKMDILRGAWLAGSVGGAGDSRSRGCKYTMLGVEIT